MADFKRLRMDYRCMFDLRGALRHSLAGFVAAVLLGPGLSLAASFDCNRATTLVKKSICADHGLSQLDESRGASRFRAVMVRRTGLESHRRGEDNGEGKDHNNQRHTHEQWQVL
jgi:hypothetical protein